MKKNFNTLHKFIFEYSYSECTKETLNDLFRSVIEPIVSEQKAEACLLLKTDDTTGKNSILKRLSFSGREIFSFNDNLNELNINNVIETDIWGSVNFVVISAKRYSAALLWDFSISETKNRAKTMLLVNSKIVTDIIKTVFENSKVENKKEIIQKYNADRRENILLNKSVNHIVSVLNEKNNEYISASIENTVLNSENDNVKTAKAITENAKLTAHEIKNNISVINLYSSILKKRLKTLSINEEEITPFNDALNNICKAAENITSAICELREISLPEKKNINLNNLISEVISLTAPRLNEKNIKIKLSGDKKQEIYTDENKLIPVIQNIVLNAADACKRGGKTDINYYGEENKTVIEISNDGEKIPENLTEKIFERDYTTKENGNGLGLYICKKMMKTLNGDITLSVSNETETKFKITL